ncbi:MAG: hypothetical protein QG657_1993 [Acidobacteriota bacterium]|nr:hypothetical protein [Acidobacteriota bacterium]
MQTTSDAATKSEKTVAESKKTRTRPQTFAQTIKLANNMVAGIRDNIQTLSPKGVNDATIQTINTLIEQAKIIETDQEILKGKLKEKTLELDNKVAELKDVLSKTRLMIKAVIRQKSWIAFGISATK